MHICIAHSILSWKGLDDLGQAVVGWGAKPSNWILLCVLKTKKMNAN